MTRSWWRGCSSAAAAGRETPALPAAVSPPSDLQVSEVTARSFRVTWTPSPGQVEKYRVVYYPASGGQPDEKVMTSDSQHTTDTIGGQCQLDAIFTKGPGLSVGGSGVRNQRGAQLPELSNRVPGRRLLRLPQLGQRSPQRERHHM